jgi:hypothetical protein
MLIKTVAGRDGRFYVTITHSFVLIESGTAEPHMKLLKNFSISSENKPLIVNSAYAYKFWQSGETSILEAFGRHRDVHSEKKNILPENLLCRVVNSMEFIYLCIYFTPDTEAQSESNAAQR